MSSKRNLGCVDRLLWGVGVAMACGVISAFAPQPVRACTMTADFFDYPAEGNLAGQEGGGEGVGAEWV
ncbi:MAG: hypothetical protein VCC04_07305, partial [Myxococcota bacterium]